MTDSDASLERFGGSGSYGPREQAARAVVDHINRSGGMGGRVVDPVIHRKDTNAGTFDSQAEATCTRFSQDDRVFAVVSGNVGGQDTLVACLDRQRIPLVTGSVSTIFDHWFFDRYPHLYGPSVVSGTRWGFWIDSLVRRDFFGPDSRIGLVRYDDSLGDRMREVVVAALRKEGLTPTSEAALSAPRSVGEVSVTSAEMSSAIARFRGDGVDRVLFVATGGAVPFLWLPQAEGQGYRPRYAFTSNENLNFQQDNVPPAQLRGAMAAGWLPIYDVRPEQDPGGRPAEEECREAFRHAGIRFGDRLAEGFALGDCDMLLFIKAVLDRTPMLDPDSFRAASSGLGGHFQPAATFTAAFGPNRRDGASTYRHVVFGDGCACWQYVGDPEPVL